MKDERGIYYYPVLQNKKRRMYVRRNGDDIEFRMWDSDDPTVWEDHHWLSIAVIKKAAEIYTSHPTYTGRSPLHLYDMDIAKQLLKDEVPTSEEDSQANNM